jgi:hypothetical protein
MVFPDSNVSSPKLSPSTDEYDDAQLTDENANVFPLVALVPVDASGHSNLGSVVPAKVPVSQNTDKRQAPLVACPGGEKIKVMGVVGLDASGNPIPFVAGSAKTATSVSGKFQSTPQTGTGSAQSIPHGLGVVPTLVLVSPYNNTAAGSTPFSFAISEGTHTTTNLLITATSGLVYKVVAFV